MSLILEINGWKAGITFAACHMIPEHRKCSRLHGHTYAVHVRIHGEKAEKGMVLDFGLVKEALEKIIDVLDHKVMLSKAKAIKEKGRVRVAEGTREYIFPVEDVVLLDIKQITAENLANYLLENLLKELKIGSRKNIIEVEVGLDEGWGQGVWIRKKL